MARKYHNQPTNGFASKKEWRRFNDLALLQRLGHISALKVKTRWPIVVNDVKVCDYEDDFNYIEKGELVVEDTKGVRTPVYRLKAKLMKAVHGITVREI